MQILILRNTFGDLPRVLSTVEKFHPQIEIAVSVNVEQVEQELLGLALRFERFEISDTLNKFQILKSFHSMQISVSEKALSAQEL